MPRTFAIVKARGRERTGYVVIETPAQGGEIHPLADFPDTEDGRRNALRYWYRLAKGQCMRVDPEHGESQSCLYRAVDQPEPHGAGLGRAFEVHQVLAPNDGEHKRIQHKRVKVV